MISIVINTFNEKPQWLRQTIDSYLANDIQKQIIVSALPDDVNMDILESYDQIEICLCDPDKHPGHGINGIYYQLHEGIKRVRGEWFCYMSSNDFVKPDRLKTELNYCLENKKLICYSDFHEVNETGTVTGSRRFFDYDYSKHIWKGNFVSDAALINTKLLIKYLPYRNELLGNYSHWDLWLRIYEGEGNVFCHLPIPTWYYRLNPDSLHLKRRKDTTDQQRGRAWYNLMLDHNNRRNIKRP